MSERFCPTCGRANRSDMPRCMNCGQRMLPTVPSPGDGTVPQGRSVLLHREADETQTDAARTGNHEPWWRTPNGGSLGAIPPPPQVKDEMARFEAREEAKANVLRAEEEAKEANLAHERKRAAAAAARAAKREQAAKAKEGMPVTAISDTTNATLLECARCGTVPPPGGGFSFCLSCGGDLSTATGSPVFNAGTKPAAQTSAKAASTMRAASTTHTSTAAPGVAGLQSLHEAESKKSGAATFSMSSSSAQTGIKGNAAPPGVAALLSFFVPGVGQIINGQVAKGVVLLLASFVVTSVLGLTPMGILPLIGRVVAALDAYRVADRRRKGQTVRPDEWDLG